MGADGILFVILGIGAYFLGNISGGIILGKVLLKKDIREYGSGNAGSTNALRVFGKKIGALTFMIDFFKGLIATGIGYYLLGEWGLFTAGVAVVVGHLYPVIYGFKGGKGIATSFGAMIFANPIFALALLTIFIVVTIVSKYVSLGSVMAALSGVIYGIYLFYMGDKNVGLMIGILGILAIFRHSQNISRLLSGNENKITINK